MSKLKTIGFTALGLFIALAILGAVIEGDDTTTDTNNAQAESKEADKGVVNEVEAALAKFDDDFKRTLASTSANGQQGDIEKVEAYGKDGVKIHVSTHFDEPGDEANGGQNIARKIMGNLCLDVPELDSVYVTSTSSGLDSRSVYRNDLAGCKL